MYRHWLAILIVLGGCGDNTTAESNSGGQSGSASTGACTPGYAGCPCTAEGLCLADLACVDMQCVETVISASGVPTGSDSDSASAGSGNTAASSTTHGATSAGSASQTGGTSDGSTASEQTGPLDGSGETAGDSGGTTASSGEPGTASSSGGGAAICGDGVAEGDEACDGADLGGQDCADLGFQFGQLGCTPGCTHDTAQCTDSAACGDGIVVQNVLCYAPPVKVSAYNMTTVKLGDMDEDGHLDLVGSGYGKGTRVLFGVGDGTFKPNTVANPDLKLGLEPLVDLDKDGHLDAMGEILYVHKLRIALGDGAGGLTTAVDYDTLPYAYHVDLADVDEDGWLDMVLCGSGSDKYLNFRRGQPGGTFGPNVSYMVDAVQGAATCGISDLDLDGLLDIWGVTNFANFRVAYGDGDGTFEVDPSVTPFKGTAFAHVDHLDGDEFLDIVGFSASEVNGSLLNVLHGDMTLFDPMVYSFAIENDFQRTGLVGNCDGNDILDVVVAAASNSVLEVFRGDGTGLFHDGVSLDAAVSLRSAAIGDLNEDGIDDLVTTHWESDQSPNKFAQQVFLSDP